MSLDLAIRLTEILMGLAFFQQSTEHLRGERVERLIFIPRAVLSLFLIVGFQTPLVCVALCGLSLFALHRFQGPYNGGSDRMSLLMLFCLTVTHFLPSLEWREYAFGYLAVQLILSYFIAGWVKIVNPFWRNGRALQDVFLFSVYPVSESLRALSNSPRLLWVAGWGVMIFELAFPFALLNPTTLVIALGIASLFHFANACLFGFNRFFWIWIAAYPSLFWLSDRVFGV